AGARALHPVEPRPPRDHGAEPERHQAVCPRRVRKAVKALRTATSARTRFHAGYRAPCWRWLRRLRYLPDYWEAQSSACARCCTMRLEPGDAAAPLTESS